MLRVGVNPENKASFIDEVYNNLGNYQTMIFMNTKKDAELLEGRLKIKGILAQRLTGDIEEAQRAKIMDDFRKTSITCLISTNVLARGIDVPEVDLVINYDVPVIQTHGFKNPDYANFLHRVGRTGRFGTDGVAVTIVSDETDEDIVDQI